MNSKSFSQLLIYDKNRSINNFKLFLNWNLFSDESFIFYVQKKGAEEKLWGLFCSDEPQLQLCLFLSVSWWSFSSVSCQNPSAAQSSLKVEKCPLPVETVLQHLMMVSAVWSSVVGGMSLLLWSSFIFKRWGKIKKIKKEEESPDSVKKVK